MGAARGVADLDYRPAERGVGLAARLRAVAANPLYVIGGTVSVLLLLIPGVVLVVLLVGGHVEDVGLLFFLVLLVAGGLYCVFDVLRKAGGGGALSRFAEVNGLRHLSGDLGTHYAGSRFSDGSHLVHSGVRTRGKPALEVGDLFPVTPVRSTRDQRRPTSYLRVVATGHLPVGPDAATALVGPELRKEVEALLGPIVVEVSGREVTVYGERGLEPTREGRLREALLLAERVALTAEAEAARDGAVPVERAPSGVRIPPLPTKAAPAGRRIHPVLLVLGTLAALVVLPVAFAVVMSWLDDVLPRNAFAASVVVPLLAGVLIAITGFLIRVAVTHRSRR